ncbi:EAL domain-containing protein, partial [Klebsiella pneumoniae]|nr:EAL domain-containing protein [Klebsiella pneumoniae]
ALLRWDSPELGMVSPARFIPLAEETGLIVPIGEWVLRSACEQLRALHELGYTELCVSVNVSARQFRHDGFCAMVAAVLAAVGLDPRYLELEL